MMPRTEPPTDIWSGGKATILVIDDSHTALRLAKEHLEHAGLQVITADDSIQGIQCVRRYRPSLILCDAQMPDLDGFEILQALQEDADTALIPIVLTSSNPAQQRQAMHLGASDFLVKPIHRNTLVTTIHAQLVKHKKYLSLRETQAPNFQEAQKRLTLMVAHELRTPLISITMAQELLQRRLRQMTHEQAEELLDTMAVGTRRLKHLTEQMVLLTHLEVGTLQYQRIQEEGIVIDLWSILTPALDLARQFDYRHWDVDVILDERDAHIQILCDPGSLRHALAEIINNAITFSEEGANVDVTQWTAEGKVWVSVADTGVGIDAEDLPRALQFFQQIGRDQREQQGMGLGLPLAKRIVEAHGGSLSVQSVPAKGTQVIIGLPVH